MLSAPPMNLLPLASGALVAGLLGSPHCVGMCGGFAGAAGAPWQAGRLAAYLALGAFAGAIVPDATWSAPLAGALLVWFAARLAGIAPALPLRLPGITRAGIWLARRRGLSGRFLLGTVSGLLPCGLLWSGLALAVAAGGSLGGALVMAAFWAGTVPALATASGALRRLGRSGPWTRRIVAAGVLAAGLWSISARVGLPPVGEVCHPQR